MDGNGRWAERRGHPRVFGHVRGSSRIKAVVRRADELGVKVITLYAFSTENWYRPETEKSTLWKLLIKFLKKEVDELDRQNVQLRIFGEVDRLSVGVREVLDPAVARLAKNTGISLNFCVSYGARLEIFEAAKAFARACLEGRESPNGVDQRAFEKYLWTSPLGECSDVDLVIRTSGEIRTSNFLLWQAAYAEYVFLDICWPDFGVKDFDGALEEYSKRDRRFGKVSSK